VAREYYGGPSYDWHVAGVCVCVTCAYTYVFILSYMRHGRIVLVKYITRIKWTLFSAVSTQESSYFSSVKAGRPILGTILNS